MRIRSFCKNVEVNELVDHNLKNCSVVIDGQNYFYNLYQVSGLPFEFGCEADKYADHLRRHLSVYAKAKVKCYIIFKGGHEDEVKRTKNLEKLYIGPTYDVFELQDSIVLPVFMKRVHKEVLDEMNIDYVVCEFESKKQCIALAQKLKCPIISYDIEFCFSGVPYIPYQPAFTYNRHTNAIQCGIFKLEDFMTQYGITKEKLAIFIVLTDENIFPALFFQSLFERERINYQKPFRRNQELILWLSRNTLQDIHRKSLNTLNNDDRQKFEEEQKKMVDFIDRSETPGKPIEYLMNGKSVTFEEHDPCWFEKGVITDRIAISYVNLYHSGTFFGSWSIEDLEADDALFLSIDIVKYAYNLLTNYKKDNISFANKKWEIQNVKLTDSVQKPTYEALDSPFENGWDGLQSLKLFDCFLYESLSGVNFNYLTSLPKDARLLLITLVYFSRRKTMKVTSQIYSILLSYVLLGVVYPKLKDNNNDTGSGKDLVSLRDCQKACSILKPFCDLTRYELMEIFDRKLLHPFVEFQHCLDNMNHLNKLCGQRSFEPTIYHKTFNGTFVYKLFCSIKNKKGDESLNTIKNMLSTAPTVLDFFLSLVRVYRQMMS